MHFPKFGLIRQRFEDISVREPISHVRAKLRESGLLGCIKNGDKVLITAGSRGIDSIKEVLLACITAIRERGGEPFLFPAMGSHGLGRPDKQVELLARQGITPDTMGVEIYPHMRMIEVGHVFDSVPVYVDQAAIDADHILLVNRIKEHTEYIGDTESGILKMAVVGLGRRAGAEVMHRLAVNVTYSRAIHAIAKVLFEKLKILGAIALLENQMGRLRRVEVIPQECIFEREPRLLEESKKYRSRLPFDALDVLIVDEIGKDISGSGMDTKVIGRIMNIYEKELEKPKITRIVVRDLSEKTAGNAIGIGLADYTTYRAVKRIDLEATHINCITAVTPEKGRIPIALPSDRAAIEAALKTIGFWSPEDVKIAWISNTKSLQWLAASVALVKSTKERNDLEVDEEWFDLPFDSAGNLPTLKSFLKTRGIQL